MKRIISLAVMCLMACVAFSQNLLEITTPVRDKK